MLSQLIIPTLSFLEWGLIAIAITSMAILSITTLYRWPKTAAIVFAVSMPLQAPLSLMMTLLGSEKAQGVVLGIAEVFFIPGFFMATRMQNMGFDNITANIALQVTNILFWGTTAYVLLSLYGNRRLKK